MAQVDFTGLWDQLLGEGKSSITPAELQERTGASEAAVYMAAKYAMDRGRLFSPVRGLYVIVPAEHRCLGVVPATHFVDPMMRHLDADYYIAFASAAQWWGAAHQAPQEFQVVTTRRVRDRQIERLRLRFYVAARLDTDAVRRVAGPRTMIKIATPSLCAVDLASRPALGGGLSNVATILIELPDLDAAEIARLATWRPRSTARRLGWLLDMARPDLDLTALRHVALPEVGAPTLVAPGGSRRGHIDEQWNVLVNATVEPDDL